jgi:uridine kinase
MSNIIITFENGIKREYPKGIKLKEIIDSVKENYKYEIICGKFKNQIISLDDSITKSGEISLYDINTPQGNKIYERGLLLLFEVSALKILGKDTKIKIRQPVGKGIYIEINKKISPSKLEEIKNLMKQKVKENIYFEKIETSRIEAIEYFKSIKREDKVKTLSYTTSKFVSLYKFEGTYNYILGDLPNSTSILKYFDLTPLEKGVVVRFPFVYDKAKITKYIHHEQFFNNLEEYSQWGNLLNINNLGELNEAIITRGAGEVINLSEILQDYKLLSIAEKISLNKNNIKVILLSGPSSSGKTTTAKKLSLYLKVLGLNPYHLSIDDYFLNRENTPLDENGKPDYESIRAIDTKLFNNQMDKLLKGVKVITPTYDFIEGKKDFNRPIQLKENDILVVEGLHALNEEISKDIPKKNKFKIYISPLSYLNIDNDNRISQTDIRLLRRIVRDYRTRGYSPSTTLSTWDSVRKGEEKYVFPYQDEANVIFNSFLAYELGVIKTYAEPLLYSVSQDDPNYDMAVRLLNLLKFVLPIPSDNIPSLSIIREFIGESYFEK